MISLPEVGPESMDIAPGVYPCFALAMDITEGGCRRLIDLDIFSEVAGKDNVFRFIRLTRVERLGRLLDEEYRILKRCLMFRVIKILSRQKHFFVL